MVVATQTRRRETPMSHYQHLTISERESIWENKLAGKSLREIAKQTGRCVSTISRELKRNGTSQKYRPSEAQKKYERRRKRCRRKKLLQEGELKDLGRSSADPTAMVSRANRTANRAGEGKEAGELCHHLPGTAQGAYGGKRDKEEPAWKISHGEAFEEKRLAREGKRAEKPAFCPPDDRGEA